MAHKFSERLSLGVDVGGTNVRLGVFSEMQLLHDTRIKADYATLCHEYPPVEALKCVINNLAQAINNVLNNYPNITAIGVGFPGFINPKSGILAQSPNLPGLNDVNLVQALSQLVGRKVLIENDANAAAYGEFCYLGCPQGGLLYVGLGTGVGGGLILNNAIFTGTHGYAMEIGHIQADSGGTLCGCGNYGCLEQFASASAIRNAYFQLTKQFLAADDIANLARAGDYHAIQVFENAAQMLAKVLANALKLLDVQNVVIGGGLAGAWDVMQKRFSDTFEASLIPVLRGQIHLYVSTTLDIAGMLGVALLASHS